jgi:hypothetical protein
MGNGQNGDCTATRMDTHAELAAERCEFLDIPNVGGGTLHGTFSGSLLASRLVPSKWRCLVPPRRIELVEITCGERQP